MITTELLHKVGQNDEEAFEQLLTESKPIILSVIFEYGIRIPEDKEDVIQNVSINIFRHINGLNEPEKYFPWLRIVTANECRKLYNKTRNMKNNVSFEECVNEGTDISTDLGEYTHLLPHEQLDKNEKRRIILSLTKRLPETQKEVLYLHYISEKREREIAELLGIPLNTVKTRMRSGKHKLKELILQFEKDNNCRLHINMFDSLNYLLRWVFKDMRVNDVSFEQAFRAGFHTANAGSNTATAMKDAEAVVHSFSQAESLALSNTTSTVIGSQISTAASTQISNTVGTHIGGLFSTKISLGTSLAITACVGILGFSNVIPVTQGYDDTADVSYVSEPEEESSAEPSVIEHIITETSVVTETSVITETSVVMETSVVTETSVVIEQLPGEVKTVRSYSSFNKYTAPHETITVGDFDINVYYEEGQAEIQYYHGLGSSIEIPSAVTYNGETYPVTILNRKMLADRYVEEITSITIPDEVTNIPPNCFEGMENLKTIKGGKNVQSIGKNAFSKTSIEVLDIPKQFPNLIEIHGNAFSECKIQTVKLPEHYSYIDTSAFSDSTIDTMYAYYTPETENNYDFYCDLKKFYLIFAGDNIDIPEYTPDEYNNFENELFPKTILSVHNYDLYFRISDPDVKINGNILSLIAQEAEHGYYFNSVYFSNGITSVNRSYDLNIEAIPAKKVYFGKEVTDIDIGLLKEILVSVAETNPVYSAEDGILFDHDKTKIIYCPNDNVDVSKYYRFLSAYPKKDELSKFYLDRSFNDFDALLSLFENVEDVTIPEENPCYGITYCSDTYQNQKTIINKQDNSVILSLPYRRTKIIVYDHNLDDSIFPDSNSQYYFYDRINLCGQFDGAAEDRIREFTYTRMFGINANTLIPPESVGYYCNESGPVKREDISLFCDDCDPETAYRSYPAYYAYYNHFPFYVRGWESVENYDPYDYHIKDTESLPEHYEDYYDEAYSHYFNSFSE